MTDENEHQSKTSSSEPFAFEEPRAAHPPRFPTGILPENFATHILERYKLQAQGEPIEQELWYLDENLTGLSLREQIFLEDRSYIILQRRLVKLVSDQTRSTAFKCLTQISTLRDLVKKFEVEIGGRNWNAPLIAQVFDIPYPASNVAYPPEELAVFRGLFEDHVAAWDELEAALRSAAAAPVRRTMPSGVRNYTLEQGLLLCRAFWGKHAAANSPWRRTTIVHATSLSNPEDISQVQGGAEGFVIEMFAAAGIKFDLKSLNGAWAALDKRLGQEEKRAGTSNRRTRSRPCRPSTRR